MNGGRPGRFLLDTGADATVLVPRVAEVLGLETVRYHEGGVAGGRRIRVPLCAVDAIAIGSRTTRLEPVAIVDINRAPGPYGEIHGVVGSDFLREFPATIDYPDGKLIFEDAPALERRRRDGTVVTLRLREGTTPFLNVRLNGAIESVYKLDTGAGTTHLPMRDLARLGIGEGDPRLTPEESTGLGGRYRIFRTRLDSLSAGPGLEVREMPVKAYETEYGLIGADYLRNFVLTLDYRGGYAAFSRS